MALSFLTRRGDTHALVVGMAGIKLGEHVAQVGCADGALLGALAKRVGLSGRFVTYAPDETSAERARRGAAAAGALADVELAAATDLPGENQSFDVAVVDDTGGFLSELTDARKAGAIREALRMLRPGGRLLVIGAAGGGGLGRLLSPGRSRRSADHEPALEAGGFKLVRCLAERDGFIFVEGIKPRETT